MQRFLCVGTYNPGQGLDTAQSCLKCPAGQFCNETGLEAPSGLCHAGYLCVEAAGHPGPNDGINGPCPLGYYCLEGIHKFAICFAQFVVC